MGFRRVIRTRIIEKLPQRCRFLIERTYTYYSSSARSHLRGDLAVIRRLCKPDKTALDIGASYGVISQFLCKYARHVHCFEPIPRIADQLRRKFADYNVTVENFALGDVEGELTLNIPCAGDKKYETRSSLVKNFDDDIILGEKITGVEKIRAKVKRLDSFDIKNIGFIKIDVEGFELEVLQGGENTIKREMPNLFVEIEKRHHERRDVQDVFLCLAKWGYLAYFVSGKDLRSIEEFDFDIMQNEELEETSNYLNDFVFTPAK